MINYIKLASVEQETLYERSTATMQNSNLSSSFIGSDREGNLEVSLFLIKFNA
jgi:hypothetical protein